MNKLFIISIAVIALVSCSESIPNEEKVVEHLRQQMKNPDSFRLDSIKYTPYYLSDQLKQETALDSVMIPHYIEMEDYYRNKVSEYKNVSYMADLVVGYRQDQKRYQVKLDSSNNHLTTTLEKYNSLKGTEQDTLVAHTYKVYYMAQNSFGAMLKGSAFVSSKPNLTPREDGEIFYVSVDKD